MVWVLIRTSRYALKKTSILQLEISQRDKNEDKSAQLLAAATARERRYAGNRDGSNIRGAFVAWRCVTERLILGAYVQN